MARDKNVDLLADFHNILNKWKNYLLVIYNNVSRYYTSVASYFPYPFS
jgi:hypothetical protein